MDDRLERLTKALTKDELKFYLNARIPYNDHQTWRKLLVLQDKAYGQ